MRYPTLCGCALLMVVLCGSGLLHAQTDSAESRKNEWKGVLANGASVAPIRSLDAGADSLVALLLRSRVTKLEDTSIIRRSYEPLMIPLDSLRELRIASGDHMTVGVIAGVVTGVVVALLGDPNLNEPANPNYPLYQGDVEIGGILLGGLMGGVFGGLIGTAITKDQVIDLDPLTPAERRALVQTHLSRASAGDLSIRMVAADTVTGEQWAGLWIAAGLGGVNWRDMEHGGDMSVPRLSFGVETPHLVLMGAFVSSSTRWFDMVELDLLAGRQFAFDPFGISVAAGPCYINAHMGNLMPPDLMQQSDVLRYNEATVGFAAALDLTLPLTDYLGIGASAYSSISSYGPMLGFALSARAGALR